MFRVDKTEVKGTMQGAQVQLLMFIAGGQNNVVDKDVDEPSVQDLALNVDNVFQADECDAFDSDIDEAPTAQTMFMANLSSADHVYGPSYDSDILSEVHDHGNYQDAICELHGVHEMHDNVQPNYLVDSYTRYTSDSNMILNNREVHLDYLKHLKESIATLREIVKEARAVRPLDISLASACLYTKHSQMLVEYLVGTCLKDFSKRDTKQATTPLNRKKQVTFENQCHTDRPLVFGLRLLNTYDRGSLTAQEFYEKFIETVRFRNDHFGAIMGYGDYVIGDNVIFRVYYVEGLGHNIFSIGKFCDSDLEVTFRKHSCYIRDTHGVELIKGSHGFNLYTISVEDMLKSSPIFLLSKASKNKSWF
nr:integrase, catalytic region, zinc finger, CCHC-type, peptidase aspartic, catalytic [Tanacetum cinerariifolium]